MDAFQCIAYLQEARAQGAWGEYLVQASGENVLIADVLAELGFAVRAVNWRFPVEQDGKLHLSGCTAIEVSAPTGTVLIDARSGLVGCEPIERHTAERVNAQWRESFPAGEPPHLNSVQRYRAKTTDQAYDRQRALVMNLLAPVLALEQATPHPSAGRGTPRL